jgi:phosphoribosylaminoimidazole-succinocarboxamide synthase
VIPWKGQVLTQLARHWFDHTADIAANHVIGYPDPNVVHCRRVTILPVEIVVRGYLAGTTSTSILTQYRTGRREMYGHRLPEGLRQNEALPRPIITPTSKAMDGGHDEPLTAGDIIETGLLTRGQWDEVSQKALALFARGQKMAAERGLILVDTKYEFGTDAAGNILLADEIHTPDSSRYWIADGYASAFAAGTRPPSFDKDVIRIEKTAQVYIDAFEAITGRRFVPDAGADSPLARVRANLGPFFGA